MANRFLVPLLPKGERSAAASNPEVLSAAPFEAAEQLRSDVAGRAHCFGSLWPNSDLGQAHPGPRI
eukprot:2318536-Pyramimonas_sp.AAC.1